LEQLYGSERFAAALQPAHLLAIEAVTAFAVVACQHYCETKEFPGGLMIALSHVDVDVGQQGLKHSFSVGSAEVRGDLERLALSQGDYFPKPIDGPVSLVTQGWSFPSHRNFA
jgi:hypothetical protein